MIYITLVKKTVFSFIIIALVSCSLKNHQKSFKPDKPTHIDAECKAHLKGMFRFANAYARITSNVSRDSLAFVTDLMNFRLSNCQQTKELAKCEINPSDFYYCTPEAILEAKSLQLDLYHSMRLYKPNAEQTIDSLYISKIDSILNQ